MTMNIANITFDCAEPQTMAAFWSAALGRDADPVTDPAAAPFFASIGVSTGERPNWLFLAVPEGKTTKNRCHLDFEADDWHGEVARLVELGATHVGDKAEWGFEWSVMNDPEGNEFCVSGPH